MNCPQSELELLMMDNDDDGKEHFNLKVMCMCTEYSSKYALHLHLAELMSRYIPYTWPSHKSLVG